MPLARLRVSRRNDLHVAGPWSMKSIFQVNVNSPVFPRPSCFLLMYEHQNSYTDTVCRSTGAQCFLWSTASKKNIILDMYIVRILLLCRNKCQNPVAKQLCTLTGPCKFTKFHFCQNPLLFTVRKAKKKKWNASLLYSYLRIYLHICGRLL